MPGIFLYKDLPTEAGLCLEKCLKKITPQIMTWGQYAEAAYAIAARKWYGKDKVALYVPDFTRCCDHFCLHAGALVLLWARRLLLLSLSGGLLALWLGKRSTGCLPCVWPHP